MSPILKIVIGALLLLLTTSACFSQERQPKDGVWLKSGVDAFNRITSSESVDVTSSDFRKSEALSSYIEGMLFVHRQNNFTASIVVVGLQKKRGERAPITPEARMALAFAPLLRVPDNLSRYQAIAIIDQYLRDNPAKWESPAGGIINDALKAAFEPSKD